MVSGKGLASACLFIDGAPFLMAGNDSAYFDIGLKSLKCGK
jgi:hypothetical protein